MGWDVASVRVHLAQYSTYSTPPTPLPPHRRLESLGSLQYPISADRDGALGNSSSSYPKYLVVNPRYFRLQSLFASLALHSAITTRDHRHRIASHRTNQQALTPHILLGFRIFYSCSTRGLTFSAEFDRCGNRDLGQRGIDLKSKVRLTFLLAPNPISHLLFFALLSYPAYRLGFRI